MAKKGERLGSTEDGRVHSEHLSVTLKRGQTAKLKEAAEKSKKPKSQLVQEALDSWIFKPRREAGERVKRARKSDR